ncbi:MAG: 23S rRNA (adenine(2503)-C(2))-methyltransferase RlmN [Lachnospiraceae bacterium]
MSKTDLKSLNYEQLQKEMQSIGEKTFRAKQIYSWIHEKLADSFDEMTNLSMALREKLEEKYTLHSMEAAAVQTSAIDGTQKYLFRLDDGNVIESVLMKYHHGNSVCISSQVGCLMGCRFCASTIGGKVRNLQTSEMLGQIYKIQKMSEERVHNVVVMGTGEPLDNYENLIQFIKMLTDEHGLNISQRNLTVSTCGIVPKIRALAGEKFQMTLALSLHATTQEKRKALMPIANKYELKEVLDACRYYYLQTGRRITFEYSLVGGVNDTAEDAAQLCALVKGFPCHVNLIPVNPIKEREFVQPARRECLAFKNKLEKNGINVTIRREMGRDIDGACGQLRKSYLDQEKGGNA